MHKEVIFFSNSSTSCNTALMFVLLLCEVQLSGVTCINESNLLQITSSYSWLDTPLLDF